MPTDSNVALQRFITALRDQLGAYDQLRRCVADLQSFLDASTSGEALDGVALSELLSQQEKALNQVDQIGTQVESARKQLGEVLGIDEVSVSKVRGALNGGNGNSQDLSLVSDMEAVVGQLVQVVEAIQKKTGKNEAMLRARLTTVSSSIGEVEKSKQAARAYGNLGKGSIPTPTYLDEKK